MLRKPLRVQVGPHRTVRVLRAIVLVVLAGVIVGIALTYGRRERPQAEITMNTLSASVVEQGPVLDQSELFGIQGTREGRPAFSLQARTVTGFEGERKLLEEVEMTIHEEAGGSVQVVAKQGRFDPTAQQAQLTGDVNIETTDGLSLRTKRLFYDSDRDMVFTGDDVHFSVGWMEGSGRGLNYLVGERRIKIADKVRLRIHGEGSIASTITAGDLVAALQDNTAVFTDDVRLERGGDVLVSHYLKLQLDDARRRVTGLRAFGDVVANLASEEGRSDELSADSLTASLSDASEALERAEASGDCRFNSGPYTSRSRTALFLRTEDRLELRGDPVVLTERDRTVAQEIDLHPKRQELRARGDVRTVSLPRPSEGRGIPGFATGSAVSFQSNALWVDKLARRAIYSGTARAWQEGTSLQAEEIILDEAVHQVRAAGKVISRWTQVDQEAPGETAGSPFVTVITAQRMVLDEERGMAHYEGGVRLTRPDATLTADVVEAYSDDAVGRRDLVRLVATGSVAVKHGGSFGTARTAELLNDRSILVLRDEEGLAEVVETATGRSMRGRTLTYDLASDRIFTESVSGGRTWITLAPDGKDAPAVDPKTRH